jgi:hypothetical protein
MKGTGYKQVFNTTRGTWAVLALLLFVGGCGAIKDFKPWPVNHLLPPTKLDEVSIQSAPNSNDTSVVLLDIVYDYGYSAEAAAAGAKVPDKAQDWYANRASLMFALKNSIAVSAFEVPPARSLPPVGFPDGYKQAKRVMVFANFQKSGAFFEIDITTLKRIRIDLLEKSMDVVSL